VFTTRRLKFFGHAMSQLLTVYEEKELALMVLTKADIERYGVDSSELTGLVNEVMKLRDIDCAVLVREEQDEVRLSFRSKVHIDVNCVARELFDGGGHERAAGATSHLSLEETVPIVKCKFGVK
jgi:phosphoesterase RecJ-like protein